MLGWARQETRPTTRSPPKCLGPAHPSPLGAAALRSLSSTDDLLRLEEQHRRDGQTHGLGSLEVDDQLELHGLLYRNVAWLGAFQDLVDVESGTPVHVRKARSIGHETSS